MSVRFEVGEIAIVRNAGRYNGIEVTVVAGLAWRPTKRLNGDIEQAECYVVERFGELRAAAEYQLRKRRPPAELTTWENIERLTGWKPKKVSA